MPAFGEVLTDEEIVAVLTFLTSSRDSEQCSDPRQPSTPRSGNRRGGSVVQWV